MGSISSDPRGNFSAGKVESPVANTEATGQQSTEQELQNEVTDKNPSGIVRWNVYESVEGWSLGEKVWGEWVLVRSHKTEDSAESEIERRRDHIHEKNSMSDYGILAVKWEKRHELMLPADSKVTQDASVTESQEVSRLQDEVTELQNQVTELQNRLQTVTHELPIEAARDRTFNKLKIGKQSAAGKAVEMFIKELKSDRSTV